MYVNTTRIYDCSRCFTGDFIFYSVEYREAEDGNIQRLSSQLDELKKAGSAAKGKLLLSFSTQQYAETVGDSAPPEEPSCTEDGRQVRVCRTCGTEFTEILPKLGHEVDESDWEIVKEPTATEDGLKVLKCQRCGEVVKEEIIPATGEAVEPTLTLTLDGQAVEGDVAYVKLPSILMLYKNHSATLGFQFDQDVEVASVKWSYANWSVSSPEANIESPDSAETVIRPNGKGIGARSTWVTLTVTDVNGNVYQQTVKVRFYKWDWQRK